MNYKALICIVTLMLAAPSLQAVSQTHPQELCDDLEVLLCDLSDTTEFVDYDKQPLSHNTNSIVEKIKINGRKLSIMVLAYAVDMHQWFIKTNARIRLWFCNI